MSPRQPLQHHPPTHSSTDQVESCASFLARILTDCQHSHGLHARRVKELVAWRSAHRREGGFMKEWWTCLLPIFLVFKREPAVERVVEFVAAFAAFRDEKHGDECDAFLEEFFGVLLYSADASNKAVRFRACQILSEIIMRLEENAEVSDELWDEVIDCMQRRMQDRIPVVRVFASRALARFANADAFGDFENDAIVAGYRKALQSDQNAEVRKTVLLSMPPSNATAPDIVRHTADINATVRRAAFTVLANKFPIQSLSIKQRTTVLGRGLRDRIAAVQNECVKVLKDAWLKKCCEGDAIVLLKYLDVETHESVGEAVMIALFKENLVPLHDERVVKGAFLKDDTEAGSQRQVRLMEAEEAFYWRMLCSYVHSEAQAKGHDAATTGGAEAAVNAAAAADKNELLEKILPGTVADYVEQVTAHLNAGPNYRFVTRQLLLLGKFLDFSDASNHKDAGHLLQNLLRMPAEHGHLDSGDEDSDVLVGDGLSLGGDKDWACAVAELSWKVYGAPGEFEEKVADAVAELGKPCREGGANTMQWVNCLALTGLLLENIQSLQQLSGCAIEAQEVLNGLLLPAAKHINPEVQRAAQRCLGLFCLREQKPSQQIVRQLRLALCIGLPPVQKLAVKALFDLIMWHGPAAVDRAVGIGPDMGPIPVPRPLGVSSASPPANNSVDVELEGNNAIMPLLEVLAARLSDGSEHVQPQGGENAGGDLETVKSLVAEGFAKLLLQSKVFPEISNMQQTILEKLLQLYFHEETKSLSRLRQCLSVFFDTYPAISSEHKKCISKAFIPVMRSEWPGVYENLSSSLGTVAAKKKHAALLSRFMLQLLHQPLFKGGEQNTSTSPRTDNEGFAAEQASGSPNGNAKVADIGNEDLAIRIAVEVAGFSYKQSAAGKSYVAMLSKIAASLEFRSSEQEHIKCMRKFLDHMKDSVAGDKQAIKDLESMMNRLKAMDNTPEEGLSDEQLQIIMSNMELEGLKFESPNQEKASIPAAVKRRGAAKRRTKKSPTPDSSPPVLATPDTTRSHRARRTKKPTTPDSSPPVLATPFTTRSHRASKTAALGKMRSSLKTSKRAICAGSDEEMSSSSSSGLDELSDADSEYEAEEEGGVGADKTATEEIGGSKP